MSHSEHKLKRQYTNLNITLSEQLGTLLQQEGVFADLFYCYGDSGTIVPFSTGKRTTNILQIIDNGSLSKFRTNPDNSYTLTKPVPLTSDKHPSLPSVSSGKFYIAIASVNASSSTDVYVDPIQTAVTTEADFNPTNAISNNFTYGSIEFTLTGNSFDQGNLTNVNGYALPMGVIVKDSTGAKISSGSYNISANNIFSGIAKINNVAVTSWNTGPLSKGNGVSKTQAYYQFANTPANGAPFSPRDWSGYVSNLATAIQNGTITTAKLAGYYDGGIDANSIYHNGGFFNYNISIDQNNDFVLTPDSNSQIKGVIKIRQGDLANSIYAANGGFYVFDNGKPYNFMDQGLLPSMPAVPTGGVAPANYAGDGFDDNNKILTGLNTQWGEIFTQFLTGLDAGFMGKIAKTSSTTGNTTGTNLSDSSNWNLRYAFNNSTTDQTGSTTQTSDPFSQFLFGNSNSYAFQYTDELNATGEITVGGPLLNLANGNGDAANIYLTLYHPNEVPGAAGGFVQPQFSDYIAASSYTALLSSGGNAINLRNF